MPVVRPLAQDDEFGMETALSEALWSDHRVIKSPVTRPWRPLASRPAYWEIQRGADLTVVRAVGLVGHAWLDLDTVPV